MDECELFPELCLYGECIDTRDSYRCKCPPGYKLGPRGVMCKGKYDISFSFSSFWVSFKLLLEHWKDQKAPLQPWPVPLLAGKRSEETNDEQSLSPDENR